MGQPTPQTKAEILKAIEAKYRSLQTYEGHARTAQAGIASLTKTSSAYQKSYYKTNLANAKGNIARCKAEIAALKVRLKQAKK